MAEQKPHRPHLFQPGQSGNPGGRPKPLLRRPDKVLSDRGVCPVEEILKLIPELNHSMQLKAWLELMSFCHSRPKETDSQETAGSVLSVLSTEDLLRLVQGNKAG